jgi:hypothetical protein
MRTIRTLQHFEMNGRAVRPGLLLSLPAMHAAALIEAGHAEAYPANPPAPPPAAIEE